MTIYNFSAGPATLPKPVLEKAQAELLNYQDSGMSVLEMSHRSPEFDKIVKDAEATLRELMAIPDNYKVIFLQGGASTQFTMVPLNLAQGKKAYYLVGGSWGKKAYTEAIKLSKTIPFEPILLASSEETVYDHIPSFDPATIDPEAAYVHLTTNNTIEGTSIYDLPDTNGVPIVADMSSNILAARYNVEDFALIYAGAQKNIGPAGVTVVIVREDFLNDQHNCLPCWITVFKLKQDHFTIHHHVSTSIFQNLSLTGLKMKLVAWTRWLKFNVRNQVFSTTTLNHLISTQILSKMPRIVLSAISHL